MKRVKEIISGIPVQKIVGDENRTVAELHYDSRQVSPEDGFIAIKGFQRDGHSFVPELYRRGCRVFFTEQFMDMPDATVVVLDGTRKWLPYLARNFYGNVVSQMKVIGITGTNGKTTTAYLLYSILKGAGWYPGLITTVEYRLDGATRKAERTTPEALDLHRYFYQMHQKGGKSVVMEVSSHALALNRVEGIPFWAAVFTNLGHDHLDFHKTMENYFRAKKMLFDGLGENARAVSNLDDAYGRAIIADCEADIFTYSWEDASATIRLKSHRIIPGGMQVDLYSPLGLLSFHTSLIGVFNLYNLMAAVATAVSLGLQPNHIIEGIESLKSVPGRAEQFVNGAGTRIFVDYAHTPEALQRILQTLLEFHPRKLTVVFGCGGDRDFEKRPLMGKVAEDYADVIILTNDNPRSEDPLKIIRDIRSGISDHTKVKQIPDRREAIEAAIRSSGRNDIVLVAGKGHEEYQEIQGRRTHFDDREVVRRFL